VPGCAIRAAVGDETAGDEAVGHVLEQQTRTIAVEDGAAGDVEGVAVLDLHGGGMLRMPSMCRPVSVMSRQSRKTRPPFAASALPR
jgi:hypothetical protein